MITTRMRARYLAAMGLAAAACTKEQPASTVTVDPVASASASTATATATATATVTATATATDAPQPPPVIGRSRPPFIHPPSCPSGKFCVTQPRHVGADAGAPSPYGMCAASVPMPGDAGMFGSPYVSFDPDGTASARAHDSKACCYTWVIPCPGGRALRGKDGDAIVARGENREDWIDRAVREAAECDARDREGLARRWAREAASEHASIASFARVTLDLLALGAPSDLVAAAQRAGLDEIEHARIAYALASAFAGKSLGPGRLAVASAKPATLESVVREAVTEGCIGEALAALALREEAEAAEGTAYAKLLDRIAEDEERHAALAYATVAWAASIDPARTAAVVAEELAADFDPARARVVREIAAPCLGALTTSSRTARRS